MPLSVIDHITPKDPQHICAAQTAVSHPSRSRGSRSALLQRPKWRTLPCQLHMHQNPNPMCLHLRCCLGFELRRSPLIASPYGHGLRVDRKCHIRVLREAHSSLRTSQMSELAALRRSGSPLSLSDTPSCKPAVSHTWLDDTHLHNLLRAPVPFDIHHHTRCSCRCWAARGRGQSTAMVTASRKDAQWREQTGIFGNQFQLRD